MIGSATVFEAVRKMYHTLLSEVEPMDSCPHLKYDGEGLPYCSQFKMTKGSHQGFCLDVGSLQNWCLSTENQASCIYHQGNAEFVIFDLEDPYSAKPQIYYVTLITRTGGRVDMGLMEFDIQAVLGLEFTLRLSNHSIKVLTEGSFPTRSRHNPTNNDDQVFETRMKHVRVEDISSFPSHPRLAYPNLILQDLGGEKPAKTVILDAKWMVSGALDIEETQSIVQRINWNTVKMMRRRGNLE